MDKFIQTLATVFFVIALIHSFSVALFAKWARRFPKGSARETFFHLLSEVEIVFGFWAILFFLVWFLLEGFDPVFEYQRSLKMTEPLFIFCIMILAATRPLVTLARQLILALTGFLARVTAVDEKLVQYIVIMVCAPLLGSLLTEPAAMTIAALLLYRMIEREKISTSLLYATIGLLFVNVSVGGALTHFAAPPILIVARVWNWGIGDVFRNLGVAALASVVINSLTVSFLFREKIKTELLQLEPEHYPIPVWVTFTHILFLAGIVLTSHEEIIFIGLFLLFIGFTTVTKKFQDGLKFREGFLVAFFLGGLVAFGPLQKWWLEPVLSILKDKTLFFTAVAMTAVTDNAALTYLGSQVPTLTEVSRWALVSGAITGGGLTILANAPNPAGFSILSSKFSNEALNAGKLFLASLGPTIVTVIIFLLLGHF